MFKLGMEILKGGKGDNIPDNAFESKELKKGTKHESEHSKNKQIQKEIAKDHITEDKQYYEHLNKVEKMAFDVGFGKVSGNAGYDEKIHERKRLAAAGATAGATAGGLGLTLGAVRKNAEHRDLANQAKAMTKAFCETILETPGRSEQKEMVSDIMKSPAFKKIRTNRNAKAMGAAALLGGAAYGMHRLHKERK